MPYFTYQQQQLFAEKVPVIKIAEQYGTPCYIYSRAALEQQWQAFQTALGNFPHRICYAVKANSNIAILNLFVRLGAGFDIVSGGELARVLAADGNPQKIIFSGVGKQAAEIIEALEKNIYCFNVESAEELTCIEKIAKKLNKRAPVSLRINPNIDAGTHPYIATGLKENKFGIATEKAISLYHQMKNSDHLEIKGISCHIGSQLTELTPFIEALEHLLKVIDDLAKENIILQHVDIGGGLGVCYHHETPPSIREYVTAILNKLQNRDLTLLLEPGRVLTANAGILLTRVEYLKTTSEKNFAIVDAAMNDLLRPALYNAWQNIIPVFQHENAAEKRYDVVGPVCETGDFLGKDRLLKIKENDLLAICSAGAYGFCMSSNYNSRPRAAEIMVDGNHVHLIRRREEIVELFASERKLAF